MGKGDLSPPWKCLKVFCALVFTVKRSVDQLFMHYFHNFCRLLGACPRPLPGFHPGPRWELSFPDPLICPPLEQILRASMLLQPSLPEAIRPNNSCVTNRWKAKQLFSKPWKMHIRTHMQVFCQMTPATRVCRLRISEKQLTVYWHFVQK